MESEEQEYFDEKGRKQFIDVVKIFPKELDRGRSIVINKMENNKIEVYIKKRPGKAGHDSKKVILNRFIELDDLFFEGLGLWQGEGGKDKGLYFGNNCEEVLLHFLRFVEQRLGIRGCDFNVTVNVPKIDYSKDDIKERWSVILRIPKENFTDICIDPRINKEYAQVYMNGIVLSELMKNLHEKLKVVIRDNKIFAASYLRGIIAGEGQIALKKSGTISHVSISSGDLNDIKWYKFCLSILSIPSGKYIENGRKFPIYGRKNLERVQSLELLKLHSIKKSKFENGINKYQRFIMKGDEMEKLILQQLNPEPKTYDEIAKVLNKGRSTIQSHYIPILEKKGLVKRIGKRKQAWLFTITESGRELIKK